MRKERIEDLDILKGICILLMVFDHVGWGENVHTYIQSFHMPVFFVVSGFLFRSSSVSLTMKKRIKTLLIPYVFFACAYFILLFSLNRFGIIVREVGWELKCLKAMVLFPTDMTNMPIAPALWFLPCMFITEVVYAFHYTVIRNGFLRGGIILGLSAPIVIFSCCSDRMLPFAIEPVASALVFYHVGNMLNQYKRSDLNQTFRFFLTVLLVLLEAVLAFINRSVDMRSARYHNLVLFFLNGLLGCAGYYGISKIICSAKKNISLLFNGIKYISINAMAYLTMNQLFILIYGNVFSIKGSLLMVVINKISIFALTLVSCTMVNKIIDRFNISYLLGRKVNEGLRQ